MPTPVRPTIDPDWATNTTYAAGPIPGQPNKATPAGGVIAEGFDPLNPLPIEYLNDRLNNHGLWIRYLRQFWHLFSTGEDGDLDFDGAATILGMVPVAGVYTLPRWISPADMRVRAGVVVKWNGFPIIGAGLLTVDATGLIHYDGLPANFQVAGAAGNTTAMLGWGTAGGRGADDGGIGGGLPAAAGVANGPALGGAGGSGATGFGVGTGAGAAGGAANAPAASGGGPQMLRKMPTALTGMLFGATAGAVGVDLLRGGAGGGGGGFATNGAACNGGGGGGGAGVGVCAFPAMNVTGTTFRAKGGAGGGAGGAGGSSGGGGGGGGGGVISLVCGENMNPGTPLDTNCDASGGAGGVGVAGGGATTGATGAAGTIHVWQL